MKPEDTTTEQEFKPGDLVEHRISGEVFKLKINTDSYKDEYRLISECFQCSFSKSGYACNTDKYPSIRLISRPKKQKKVEVVRWVNVYDIDFTTPSYDSPERARKESSPSAIAAAVEMRGHYFVEEE